MSKVSWATTIDPGLGGPKVIPRGAADGQTVNIPSLVIVHLRDASGWWQRTNGNVSAANWVTRKPGVKGNNNPYRRPTQVDRSSRPRRSEEPSLRNSAI